MGGAAVCRMLTRRPPLSRTQTSACVPGVGSSLESVKTGTPASGISVSVSTGLMEGTVHIPNLSEPGKTSAPLVEDLSHVSQQEPW